MSVACIHVILCFVLPDRQASDFDVGVSVMPDCQASVFEVGASVMPDCQASDFEVGACQALL